MEFLMNCVIFLSLLVSAQSDKLDPPCTSDFPQSTEGYKSWVTRTLPLPKDTGILHRNETQGSSITLSCKNNGIMTWEKGSGERRKSKILTAQYGKVTKYKRDLEDRYGVMANQSLIIKNLSPSDSGIYYCNSFPVAILIVSPAQRAEVSSDIPTTASAISSTSGVSVVETVLMFGGVGMAALMFLLATVAAGRVILHQAWLAGWTAGRDAALSLE
ncbi:hypothetical protein MHYP_G00173370 [Metynnis hypsauchen]